MYSPHIALLSTVQASDTRTRARLRFRRRPSDTTFTDPRVEQLIVHRALLEHMLQQKEHYDHERDLEQQRLERFRCEGANERRLQVQEQVVKKAKAMLPGIVFKMRNQVDKLKRFLEADPDQELQRLDANLYNTCNELLKTCQTTLDNPL